VLDERNVLRAVSMQTWDALVIGSGQAGVPLAVALARANRRTAIVERADVGGTCINVGCTPTKTLVASARVAALAGRAAEYGLEPLSPRARWPEVREREQSVVRQFRAGGERRLRDAGATLLRGEARFIGPRRIRVTARDGTTEEHSAPLVVLNTGVRPRVPELEGLASVKTLDSSSILTVPEFPSRLLILGGGFIALELGQIFRRLGAEVTIVEGGPRLAAREDDEISRILEQILREDGITLHLGIDGIAAVMILLNGVVTFAGTLISYKIEHKNKDFFILFWLHSLSSYSLSGVLFTFYFFFSFCLLHFFLFELCFLFSFLSLLFLELSFVPYFFFFFFFFFFSRFFFSVGFFFLFFVCFIFLFLCFFCCSLYIFPFVFL